MPQLPSPALIDLNHQVSLLLSSPPSDRHPILLDLRKNIKKNRNLLVMSLNERPGELNDPEEATKLITSLVGAFMQLQEADLLHLINSLVSIDYEKSSSYTQQEAPKVSDNTVIALPCYSDSSAVEVRAPGTSDEGARGPSDEDVPSAVEAQSYWEDDQESIGQYEMEPFTVIRREGISPTMTHVAKLLCEDLIQKYLSSPHLQQKPSLLLQIVRILAAISPPIYSSHLIKLFGRVVEAAKTVLSAPNFGLTVEEINQLLCSLNRISSRWERSVKQGQKWEWEIMSLSVVGLLGSSVSQTQLSGVKLLCEACRRSEYGMKGSASAEEIRQFLSSKQILKAVYSVENHTQVISKGKEVVEFISRHFLLTPLELSYPLDLLDKCHQNAARSIYLTIQSLGKNNLQLYHGLILERIVSLPRAACFMEETLHLVQSLLIMAPLEELHDNMKAIFEILSKNDLKLKKNLKQRLVRVYFQLFIMGVEEDAFGKEKQEEKTVIHPLLHQLDSTLAVLMLETFARVVKNQSNKPCYRKCKQILNNCIDFLFAEAQVHKQVVKDEERHLGLIKFLMETYDMDSFPISYEDLCVLVERKIEFIKFIQYFGQEQQLQMVRTLLTRPFKSKAYLQNIIGVYSLLKKETRATVLDLLSDTLLGSSSKPQMEVLADFLSKVKPDKIQDLCQRVLESEGRRRLAYLMLLRRCVLRADEGGFGTHLPFFYMSHFYSVDIKVTNSFDVFKPILQTFSAQSYQTVGEVIAEILTHFGLTMGQVMMKVNERAMSINHLTLKVSELVNGESAAPCLGISLFEAYECEWFDKSQLINEGILKEAVVVSLREIFTKFSSSGRMYREGCARLFETATETDKILTSDTRIEHLFSHYSESGQFLTLEQWLNFYQKSAEDNPGLVIDNLKKLGYRKLFKDESEILAQCSNSSVNEPREFLVQQGKPLYELLFSDHPDPDTNQQCFSLLTLLPLYPEVSLNRDDSRLVQLDEKVRQNKTDTWRWYSLSILKQLQLMQSGSQTKQFSGLNHLAKDYDRLSLLPCVIEGLRSRIQRYEGPLLPLEMHILELEISLCEKLCLAVAPNDKLKQAPNDHESSWQFCSYAQIEQFILGALLGKQAKGEKLSTIEGVLNIYLSTAIEIDPTLRPNPSLVFHSQLSVCQTFNNFYSKLVPFDPLFKRSYLTLAPPVQHCEAYFQSLARLLSQEEELEICRRIGNLLVKSVENLLQEQSPSNSVLLSELSLLNSIKLYHPNIELPDPKPLLVKLFCHSHSNQMSSLVHSLASKFCDLDFNLDMLMESMAGVELRRNSVILQQPKMGLFNLGATCYINSTVQQLFMIEPFRLCILGSDVAPDPKSYFYHFQAMFYEMAYGNRSFYIPTQFCLHFTGPDNQPIDVKEQHDADEFLNTLLDRLEQTLGEGGRTTIKQNLCGQLANMITCQSCFTTKSKTEDFYVLSLEIKNQKTLSECFEKLTEPEIITDYYCEICAAKVESIEKTIKLETLPNYLFLHFQRLVFDLESLSKIKLGHPIDFPLDFDLTDYLVPDQSLEGRTSYRLKGFVVHRGTSDSGHYYSFVKQGTQWVKFDDSRVEQWNWTTNSEEKDNAYLLIYERTAGESELETTNMGHENKMSHENALYQEVQRDNKMLVKESLVVQDSFPQHLLHTISKIEVPVEFLNSHPNQLSESFHPAYRSLPLLTRRHFEKAQDIILQYLNLVAVGKGLGSSGVSLNTQHLKFATSYLVMEYHLCPDLLDKALPTLLPTTNEIVSKEHVEKILLHPNQLVRQSYKLIFSKVMSIITFVAKCSLLIPAPRGTHFYYAQQVLTYMVGSLVEAARNHTKMEEHFGFMLILTQMSAHNVEFFNAQGLVPKLIHFLAHDETPLKGQLPNFNFSPSKHLEAVDLITNTVRILIEKAHSDFLSLQVNRKVLIRSRWYHQILQNRYQYENVNWVLAKVSWEEPQLSSELIRLILQNLNRQGYDNEYILAYLHLAQELLAIDDSLCLDRTEAILGVPQLFLTPGESVENQRYCKYWNNSHKLSDEIILPLLELLFTNRFETNYLTLGGTAIVLRLAINKERTRNYLRQLPLPLPYKSHGEWMQLQVKQGLERDVSLFGLDKKRILNQIAHHLSLWEPESCKHSIEGFEAHGMIQERERLQATDEPYYRIGAQVLEDSQGNNFTEYSVAVKQPAQRILVRFRQPNYGFTHFFEAGEHSLSVPFHQLYHAHEWMSIQILKLGEPAVEEATEIVEGKVEPEDPAFQCPFCGSLSSCFSSQCPSCGEDWGQMM